MLRNGGGDRPLIGLSPLGMKHRLLVVESVDKSMNQRKNCAGVCNGWGILEKHMNLGETIAMKISALPWRQLGHILLVSFLAAIAGAIFYKPAKTNSMYLSEILENNVLEQTAARLVTQLRASPDTRDNKESDWRKIERGLSECLLKKATEYAASNDPYLSARANTETPTILANRFLKACGAID